MNIQKGDKVAYIVTGTVAQVHLMPSTKEPYVVFEGNEKGDLFDAASLVPDEGIWIVKSEYGFWCHNFDSNGEICGHPYDDPEYYDDLETAQKVAKRYYAKVYQVFHKEVIT
jgi:hypothetical protein